MGHLVTASLLCVLLFIAACQRQQAASSVEPENANTLADEPAKRYAEILIELAVCIEDPDPVSALTRLRALLAQRRDELLTIVQQLHTHVSSLDDTERTHFVARHQEHTRSAMDRFARSQQDFRVRASQAQTLELSELLNTLR